METRICKRCELEQLIKEFVRKDSKCPGFNKTCDSCYKTTRRNRETSPENKDINRKKTLKYEKNNVTRIRDKNRRRKIELHDSYVAYIVSKGWGLKPSDIPMEIIELKRAQIKLNRLIRKLNTDIIIK